jgi:hypothetical protein
MKHFVICIKSGSWIPTEVGTVTDTKYPEKDEIYEVEYLIHKKGKDYFLLTEFESLYAANAFRMLDNTFGHVVTETIEQQLQLEKSIAV